MATIELVWLGRPRGPLSIDPLSVLAFGGPEFPQMLLNLDWTPRDDSAASAAMLLGRLFAMDAGRRERLIGSMAPQPIVAGINEIKLALSPFLVKGIEKIRAGGDLSLRFQPTVLFLSPGAVERQPAWGWSDGSQGIEFSIPKSTWLERVLNEIGWERFGLIEIPIGNVQKARRSFHRAISYLDNAKRMFDMGDDRESMINCYLAFENLAKSAKTKSPDEAAFIRVIGGNVEARKAKEFAEALHRICDFLQLARHDNRLPSRSTTEMRSSH